MHMTTFNTLNKTEARAACKKAGIKYTNMTVADMRLALELHAHANRPTETAVVGGTEEPIIEAASVEEVSEQRTDDAPAAPVEAPAAEPVAEPKKPKAPAAPKDQRNGITRPGKGKCLDVWITLDSMKAQGVEITFALLRAAIPEHIADATLRTQRQRWKTYNDASLLKRQAD
jgi:hypothetical protein